MLTMNQITMCNVKGEACSNEPTENYQQTQQLPFSSMKWLKQ